jgi:hypothetical protein
VAKARRLKHPIIFLTVIVLVVIGVGVGVLAATVPSSGPNYSVRVLVADVNAFYQSVETGSGLDLRLQVPRPVPLSATSAARRVIAACNEGQGTRVIASGLVTGVVNAGSPSSMAWAIFMDPPGKHISPSTVLVRNPEVLNWYAGFVSVRDALEPIFCTFGRAANLPPLATVPEPG